MKSIILDIADIRIQIQSNIEAVIDRFEEFYKCFIIESGPNNIDHVIEIINEDFSLKINNKIFINENFLFQGYAYKQDKENKKSLLIVRSIKNAFQYTEEFLLFIFSELCMDRSQLIFHSATLFDEDFNAHVFFGPSGIGKSTLSNKMSKLLVYSDDMVVIKKQEKDFRLYKTPFERNKTHKPPQDVQIKGFYRLVQDDNSYRVKLSSGEGLTCLLSNYWFNEYSKSNFKKYLTKTSEIFGNIQVYELHLDKEIKEDGILTILNK